MLSRYRIVRGKRSADEPASEGLRVDIRRHVRHVLAPTPEMVDAFLLDTHDERRAAEFARAYRRLLEQRFASDPTPFDELAQEARDRAVFIGCSCPTKRQPEVLRCHTVLALRFMAEQFPDLDVRIPGPSSP